MGFLEGEGRVGIMKGGRIRLKNNIVFGSGKIG